MGPAVFLKRRRPALLLFTIEQWVRLRPNLAMTPATNNATEHDM
jgi:hypothetical protein